MLMRKTGITTAAVALVLLCGCTQQDFVPTFEMSDYRITLTSDYSVNVDVSTSEGGQTRASYDNIADGQLSQDGIGIFCLPARKINTTADDFDWFKAVKVNDGEVTNANGIYWDNVKFKVLDDVHSTKNGVNYHKLEMDQGGTILEYYPLSSDYGYDFYGYAPYQEGKRYDNPLGIMGYGQNRLTVDFKLDGSQDIIYGRSNKPEGENANRNDYYSARYFRQTGLSSAVEMDFEHKLTRLNFYVIPKPDEIGGETSYVYVDSLAVKSIKLHKVITGARLILADKPNPNSSDPFVDQTGNLQLKTETGTFSLRGTGWKEGDLIQSINHDSVVNGKIKIGEHLMVCPAENYEMELVLCDKNDSTKVYPARTLKLALEGNTFKPGYQYNINISVSGPVGINLISAQLIEWKEEENNDVNVSYGNES